MKVIGDGFTSELGQAQAKKIFEHHHSIFNEIETIIQECTNFLISIDLDKKDNQKIISLILFIRLIEATESATLLAKNGLSQDVNSLFRIFLDAYFILANVCKDSNFISEYFSSDLPHRLKFMNAIEKQKNSEIFERANKYATTEIKSELKKKIEEKKIHEFNSYKYANNVDCLEIYDSMYRALSKSIHTTPRSLEQYTDEDKEGNIIHIKYHPTEHDIDRNLYNFGYFLIISLNNIQDIFECLNQEKINHMKANLNKSAQGNLNL